MGFGSYSKPSEAAARGKCGVAGLHTRLERALLAPGRVLYSHRLGRFRGRGIPTYSTIQAIPFDAPWFMIVSLVFGTTVSDYSIRIMGERLLIRFYGTAPPTSNPLEVGLRGPWCSYPKHTSPVGAIYAGWVDATLHLSRGQNIMTPSTDVPRCIAW